MQKKNFEDWFKTRHNILEGKTSLDDDAVVVESFWRSVLGGAAAGGALGSFAPGIGNAIGSLAGGTLGAIGGALGGAAGGGLWSAYPWLKQKAQRFGRRRSQVSEDPVDYQQAADQLERDGKVAEFAANLGLNRVTGPVHQSLMNIMVARLFGKEYGVVEEADLAQVWSALQRRVGKGKNRTTLAASHGIPRPFAIIGKVPGIRPGTKYAITRDAVEYDKNVVAQGINQTPPAPRTGTMNQTPTPEPGGSGLSGIMLNQHVDHLLNMSMPGGTGTVRDFVNANVPSNRTIPPIGTGPRDRAMSPRRLSRIIASIEHALSAASSRSEERILNHIVSQLKAI